MSNKLFLKQHLAAESLVDGNIKGIAYTGAPIKNHGPFQNLIIDLSTLTVAKAKTPIFRDHMPFQVAGQGSVTISEDVKLDGRISQKNQFGKEIIELAQDGFEWEMSIGVYDGQLEEFENEEYNGITLTSGVVLKNGVIREVSVVALGADSGTNAEVFSLSKTIDSKKGESVMLNKEQWVKLACGCGGNEKTTPEELEQTFAASKEEVDKLKAEIDALKKEIADKQAIIDEATKETEMAARTTEVEAAVKAKGLEFKPEVLAKASLTAESKEMFLSMLEGMEAKKIDKKFTENVDLGRDPKLNKEDPNSIQLAASKMVEEGKAKDFLTALSILGEK